MKRSASIPACLFFLACFFPYLQGQDGGTGMGLLVGEPSGISFKTWVSGRSAFDAGLAWSFRPGAFHTHTDYLWHNFSVCRPAAGKLPLYMGAGGRVMFSGTDVQLGIRVPIGMDYIFSGDRLDLFVEAVPVLNLYPETGFDFNAGIGIRYFFVKKKQ